MGGGAGHFHTPCNVHSAVMVNDPTHAGVSLRNSFLLLEYFWAGLDSSTILDVLISSTVYDKYCQHFLAMLKYINSFQHKIGIILSMLSYTNGLCKVSKTDIKSCLVSTTL